MTGRVRRVLALTDCLRHRRQEEIPSGRASSLWYPFTSLEQIAATVQQKLQTSAVSLIMAAGILTFRQIAKTML